MQAVISEPKIHKNQLWFLSLFGKFTFSELDAPGDKTDMNYLLSNGIQDIHDRNPQRKFSKITLGWFGIWIFTPKSKNIFTDLISFV